MPKKPDKNYITGLRSYIALAWLTLLPLNIYFVTILDQNTSDGLSIRAVRGAFVPWAIGMAVIIGWRSKKDK